VSPAVVKRKEKRMEFKTTERYGAYRFGFVRDNEDKTKVKIYILEKPSYNGRSTNSYTIHVYSGRNGSPPYICIKNGHKPSSLGEAKTLARKWADMTDEYIRTGVPISEQP
jgi:hypothetical protein